jgi:hypothetical protein
VNKIPSNRIFIPSFQAISPAFGSFSEVKAKKAVKKLHGMARANIGINL